jgi:hypothetical protein
LPEALKMPLNQPTRTLLQFVAKQREA